MKCTALAIALAAFSAVGSGAPSEPLATGEYGRDGGDGTLIISEGTSGEQSFRLSAEGANGHSCNFSGSIEGGKAQVNVGTPAEPYICTVGLDKYGDSLSVALSVTGESAWERCRTSMCGARADFSGKYILLPPSCTDSARTQTRDGFAHAFRSGDYQQAVERFRGLQTQCARFLNWLERDRIHNNLAMALHRLGRDRECLQELRQTEAATLTDEAKLREHFVGVPYDLEQYLPVARTTWKVQRACNGSSSGAPLDTDLGDQLGNR